MMIDVGYIVEEKSKVLRANSSEKLRERHRLSLSLSLSLYMERIITKPMALAFHAPALYLSKKRTHYYVFYGNNYQIHSLVLVFATSSNHIGASCRLDIRKRIGLNVTKFSDQGLGKRVNDWTLALGMQELLSYMKFPCAPFLVS